jgi:hypothetical protein
MRPSPSSGTARRLAVARRLRHAGVLIQAARVADPAELEREMSGEWRCPGPQGTAPEADHRTC